MVHQLSKSTEGGREKHQHGVLGQRTAKDIRLKGRMRSHCTMAVIREPILPLGFDFSRSLASELQGRAHRLLEKPTEMAPLETDLCELPAALAPPSSRSSPVSGVSIESTGAGTLLTSLSDRSEGEKRSAATLPQELRRAPVALASPLLFYRCKRQGGDGGKQSRPIMRDDRPAKSADPEIPSLARSRAKT